MKKILLMICFFASVAISAQLTYVSNGLGSKSNGAFVWNDAANWYVKNTTTNGIPTIMDDVEFDQKIEIVANGAGGKAKSLKALSASAQLIIRENTSLEVTGDLDFSLGKANDAMVIYGQFAGQKIGTMTFGGTYSTGKKIRIRKRVSDGTWHLIGVPFLNARVDHTTAHGDTKLLNNGTVLSLASYNDANASGSKYTYYTNSELGSGPKFGTAQGYSISVSDASSSKDEFTLQGIPHNGSVTYTLSTAGNGFNLLGNPYISYLQANDAADGTNNILRVNGLNGSNILTEDTIWLWDGDAGAWITKNLGDASFRIAPLQGFFVKASSASAFSFTKSMESHTETDAFLKSSDNRFEIDLSIASGEKSTSTAIRYIDNKTISFDNGYDSSLFGGYASELEVYTGLVEGGSAKKLAIQSLPNANFEDMIVPVGVTATENSEITFTAEALNVPAGYKVFLEDRLNNTFTRLDEANAKYTATVAEKSTEGRFYLHTSAKSVLSVDSNLLNSISIYKSNNSTLRIVGLSQGNTSISLYNALGKQVMSSKFNVQGVKEIPLPKLATGVYIVQLETEKGKLNKKIILE